MVVNSDVLGIVEALHQRISRLEAGLGAGVLEAGLGAEVLEGLEAVPEKELGGYEGQILYIKHWGRSSGYLKVTLERYDRTTGKKTVLAPGGDRQSLGPGAVLYRKRA